MITPIIPSVLRRLWRLGGTYSTCMFHSITITSCYPRFAAGNPESMTLYVFKCDSWTGSACLSGPKTDSCQLGVYVGCKCQPRALLTVVIRSRLASGSTPSSLPAHTILHLFLILASHCSSVVTGRLCESRSLFLPAHHTPATVIPAQCSVPPARHDPHAADRISLPACCCLHPPISSTILAVLPLLAHPMMAATFPDTTLTRPADTWHLLSTPANPPLATQPLSFS